VLAQPKRVALLTYLRLARPRGQHRRDTLVAMFWPDQDEERARNSLSQAVHFLRRSLGADTIVSHDGDALSVAADRIWCDVQEFESALDGGRLDEALALYRGDLLEGFHVGNAPDFERWLDSERQRLAQRYDKAVESIATEREAARDFEGAVLNWRRLALRDPYDSKVALRLMRAIAAAGDAPGAVKHAQLHEKLLRKELDLAPPAEIDVFIRQLRVGGGGGVPSNGGTAIASAVERAPNAIAFAPQSPTWPGRSRGTRVATVAGIALVIAVGVMTMNAMRATTPKLRSLAVLPFKDLSSDSTRPLFADAMHDAVITELARYPELIVKSRTSMMQFGSPSQKLPEIARELNADGIVVGSVQHVAGRVRVRIQLIHGATDRHLWAETFTRDVWDELAIQEDLANAIARQVRVAAVLPSAQSHTSTSPRQLYLRELYLRGKHHELNRTPTGVATAKEAYERALREDSTFALGHAALSNLYSTIARYSYADPNNARDSARYFALRAVALDSNLSEAHTALAISLGDHLQWGQAEREFKTAIALSPSDAQARYWYAMFLVGLGRGKDGMREARQVQALEPFPMRGLVITLHNAEYIATGQRPHLKVPPGERWTEFLRKEPGEPYAYRSDAFDLAEAGKCVEARRQIKRTAELAPEGLQTLAALSMVEWWCGDRARAHAMLEEVKARPFSNSQGVPIAFAHAIRGEIDSAFVWLDRMEWRFPALMDLRGARWLDPIRGDPRYDQLLRRLGVPVENQK
jgi:DNA-binding SARP family transcriptional activator/TolB-like protein/Tfp pilus assembly protein PilF